jgi:hypothetical protein
VDNTATLELEIADSEAAWSDLVRSLALELDGEAAGLDRFDPAGDFAMFDCTNCQIGDGSLNCSCSC